MVSKRWQQRTWSASLFLVFYFCGSGFIFVWRGESSKFKYRKDSLPFFFLPKFNLPSPDGGEGVHWIRPWAPSLLPFELHTACTYNFLLLGRFLGLAPMMIDFSVMITDFWDILKILVYTVGLPLGGPVSALYPPTTLKKNILPLSTMSVLQFRLKHIWETASEVQYL